MMNVVYRRPAVPEIVPIFLPPVLREIGNIGYSIGGKTERLRRFLNSNNGKLNLTLAEIVQSLNLQISTIQAGRLFKREVGIGVREYAKRLRLITAAVLLRLGAGSSKEIAARLGYRGEQDFARAFRGVFKQSPIEFRESQHRSCKPSEDVGIDTHCETKTANKHGRFVKSAKLRRARE